MTSLHLSNESAIEVDRRVHRSVAPVDCHRVRIGRAWIGERAAQRRRLVLIDGGSGQIGVEMGLIRPTNYVALVAAGLVSVIAFPPGALVLLKRSASSGDRAA